MSVSIAQESSDQKSFSDSLRSAFVPNSHSRPSSDLALREAGPQSRLVGAKLRGAGRGTPLDTLHGSLLIRRAVLPSVKWVDMGRKDGPGSGRSPAGSGARRRMIGRYWLNRDLERSGNSRSDARSDCTERLKNGHHGG